MDGGDVFGGLRFGLEPCHQLLPGVLKLNGGVVSRDGDGGAQAAPDVLIELGRPLQAGPDRGGDALVELRGLVGAHHELHSTDTDQCQQKYGEGIFQPTESLFKIFHGFPQKNKNSSFQLRQKRLYYK